MSGLLIQELKTLVKSPASISILVIPLVLLVGLGYLLPSGWIVPSSITIGIVAAVLLYFGGSIEEIKRTSFMKSVSLTRLSKLSFLATKILFAMLVSMLSVLWVLFFSWVFTETSIAFLATDFSNLLGSTDSALAVIPFKIQWDRVQWFNMLYAGVVTIVVAVSLSFVFVAFAKSSLSFYLMSFGYLLAMILFGGVVMPGFLISKDNSWFKSLYYIVPNFYTNNIMANSFSGGILPSIVGPVVDNITSTELVAILTANIDPEVFANASDVDKQAVQTLFEAGTLGGVHGDKIVAWDGSMADLDKWYNGELLDASDNVVIVNHSEYIDQVYDILSMPKTLIDPRTGEAFADWSGFVGWGVMRNTLDSIWNIVSVIIGSETDLISIIDKINIDAVGLSAWNVVGNLFISGSFSIPFVVNITLPFSFFDIITNGLQGQNEIPMSIHNFFNGIAEALENSKPELYNGLVGMFGDLEWWNWPIPWIEGILFLGVSIQFFKWS